MKRTKIHCAVAVTLVACGGMVDPQATDDQPSAAQAGKADNGKAARVPPLPTGIPRGAGRAAGAVGTTPCAPLEQPATTVPATLAKKPIIEGMSPNWTLYVIDDDPDRQGEYRAFVGHKFVLERHAVSAFAPGTFVIDRGMPNQVTVTATSVVGGGQDGPLGPIPADLSAAFGAVSEDSPESLVYGPSPEDWQGNELWVVGPSAGGALGVPRVFYGTGEGIAERTFLGFGPTDSYETATPATSVTFDLDGTPTTMPTVVDRRTAGLINGFGSNNLPFRCF